MANREKLNWLALVACLLGGAYHAALLVLGSAALEAPEAVFFLTGLGGLGMAALLVTISGREFDDERDLLIRGKSLALAARILILGLLFGMALSNGGSLRAMPKPAIWLVLLSACAAASGRSLYLYRNSV